jgi:NAD(P)H-flavin reductase
LTGGERPFSFSSAADRPGAPSFTVRPRGAVSGALRDLRPGDRVLLDGPHGTLRPSDRGLGLVLVAGGIGITPVVSMLRTLADRGDGRPMLLLYANRRWEDVPFREELDELAGRLDLRVVHVLGEPPASWDGERGRLTADVIARHLPADAARHQCVVCGPPGMVTAAVDALTRLGIPRRRIDAEGFGTGALSWRSDPTTAGATLFAVVAVAAAVAFALVRS